MYSTSAEPNARIRAMLLRLGALLENPALPPATTAADGAWAKWQGIALRAAGTYQVPLRGRRGRVGGLRRSARSFMSEFLGSPLRFLRDPRATETSGEHASAVAGLRAMFPMTSDSGNLCTLHRPDLIPELIPPRGSSSKQLLMMKALMRLKSSTRGAAWCGVLIVWN